MDYVPRMEGKWDYVGFQLRQGSLVSELRSSPESNTQKLLRIIDAWFHSYHLEAPVCAATVSTILRSRAVKLDDVASDFAEVRCIGTHETSANRLLHLKATFVHSLYTVVALDLKRTFIIVHILYTFLHLQAVRKQKELQLLGRRITYFGGEHVWIEFGVYYNRRVVYRRWLV